MFRRRRSSAVNRHNRHHMRRTVHVRTHAAVQRVSSLPQTRQPSNPPRSLTHADEKPMRHRKDFDPPSGASESGGMQAWTVVAVHAEIPGSWHADGGCTRTAAKTLKYAPQELTSRRSDEGKSNLCFVEDPAPRVNSLLVTMSVPYGSR